MALEADTLSQQPLAESVSRSPFVDPWEILRRRWKTLAAGVLAGVWAGAVFYFSAPPVYESTAQVLVIQKDPNLPAQGTDRAINFASNQFSNLLTTHLQLVVSPRVVQQAIRDQRLDLLPTIERVRKAEDPDGLHYIIEHLEPVLGDPEHSETETSRVLQVTYKHSSPEECGLVLRAIIESYQRFVRDKFHDVGSDAVRLLTQAKSELSDELKKEEAGYLDFLEHAPLLWRGDGGKSTNIYQQRILALEAAIADVRLRHTEAKARLEVIESALRRAGRPALSEIDQLALLNEKEVARLQLMLTATKGDSNNEVFQSIQPHRAEAYRARYAQLLELEAKERSLLIELGEKHPRVLEQRERIRATRAFLEKNSPNNDDLAHRQLQPNEMIGTYVELLKHDVDDLDKRERELLEHSAREAEAAKSLLIYELRGEALHQEVQRRRDLYEAVVDRLKEVHLINDFGSITTEVVAPAEFGQEPKLYLPMVLVIGTVLGTFCGGGIAWVADARDRSLRDPADVRRHTGQLPILAHVLQFGPDATERQNGLVVEDAPESPAAKSIRTLCTALGAAGRESPLQVLEIVSSNDGDGKSTLAANLAAALARAGNRVLAIDADTRTSDLHKLLQAPNRVGLSDVIAGAVPSTGAVEPTRVKGLDLLSGGTTARVPDGWITSPTFKILLNEMRKRYELIVIDTPAVLLAADACELAASADGVVLVVNPSATERTQALRATQSLRAAGAQMLGVVVNAVDRQGPYECDDLIEIVGQSNSDRTS